MKITLKTIIIMAVFLAVSSCATTTAPLSIPEKYNLDDELTSINRLSAVNAGNWEQVDDQSVMFTANGGKFYLMVLNKPLEEMDSKIGFVGSIINIQVGFNNIYVGSSYKKRFYRIEKIYKMSGMDQAKKIKELLNKN